MSSIPGAQLVGSGLIEIEDVELEVDVELVGEDVEVDTGPSVIEDDVELDADAELVEEDIEVEMEIDVEDEEVELVDSVELVKEDIELEVDDEPVGDDDVVELIVRIVLVVLT